MTLPLFPSTSVSSSERSDSPRPTRKPTTSSPPPDTSTNTPLRTLTPSSTLSSRSSSPLAPSALPLRPTPLPLTSSTSRASEAPSSPERGRPHAVQDSGPERDCLHLQVEIARRDDGVVERPRPSYSLLFTAQATKRHLADFCLALRFTRGCLSPDTSSLPSSSRGRDPSPLPSDRPGTGSSRSFSLASHPPFPLLLMSEL
jgi:hypothetical protein